MTAITEKIVSLLAGMLPQSSGFTSQAFTTIADMVATATFFDFVIPFDTLIFIVTAIVLPTETAKLIYNIAMRLKD